MDLNFQNEGGLVGWILDGRRYGTVGFSMCCLFSPLPTLAAVPIA